MSVTPIKSSLIGRVPGVFKLPRIECNYDSGTLNWSGSLDKTETVYTFSADEKLYIPTAKKWQWPGTPSGATVAMKAYVEIDYSATAPSPGDYGDQWIRAVIAFRLKRLVNDLPPLLTFAPELRGISHTMADGDIPAVYPVPVSGNLKIRSIMRGSFTNETDDGSPVDEMEIMIDVDGADAGTFRVQMPWFEIWLYEALARY